MLKQLLEAYSLGHLWPVVSRAGTSTLARKMSGTTEVIVLADTNRWLTTLSQMKEEGMDLESFCLLDENDEDELAEVGVGENDIVAFRGLLGVIRISRNIA